MHCNPSSNMISALLSVALLSFVLPAAQAGWPRPPWQDHARMARWLVHASDWGTMSVVSSDGMPLGGAVSLSDGPDTNPTGRLLFYLSPMDEVTQALMAASTAAFTVTEAQRLPGGCGGTDAEDPTCAKATLLGEVREVPGDEQELARALMFARHPAMASWPQDHRFTLFELHIQAVHLLDYFGGMALICPDDYWAVQPQPSWAAATVAV